MFDNHKNWKSTIVSNKDFQKYYFSLSVENRWLQYKWLEDFLSSWFWAWRSREDKIHNLYVEPWRLKFVEMPLNILDNSFDR